MPDPRNWPETFAMDGTPLPATQGSVAGDHRQDPDPDWRPL